ncbi:substrate-binding domain-containing protein [Candidatus Clostridium helianthi]|jgi:methyl-galactoside transport system substrate-binding protein|uniref:Substrate-binding domain-containing protein n=1 Tax=Candidatus Clostridium helianthi TaxID=3381660 RepID=A0ABW8S466_9CLOT
MNILKKILSAFIAFILLLPMIEFNAYAAPNTNPQNPVKVGVFLYNAGEEFYSRIKENLENIQKENENKVQFTFFDSKTNQGIQNDNITQALSTKAFGLYVVSPVSRDIEQSQNSISRIISERIPLIILAPPDPSFSQYLQDSTSVIIGGDDEQSGVLQGELIVGTWNSNKEILDKNKDNMMQYAILQGPVNDPATLARTKSSIQTINDAGIKTQELFSIPCGWMQNCARVNLEDVFFNLTVRLKQ